MLAALVSTTVTLCVSPPFLCVWRLLPSSWFSSASSVLRSLNYVLYLGFFLFPGFLSLVLILLEQLPFAFSSAWAPPPLFFVVCQVPAGGRSCNTTQKKNLYLTMGWHIGLQDGPCLIKAEWNRLLFFLAEDLPIVVLTGFLQSAL